MGFIEGEGTIINMSSDKKNRIINQAFMSILEHSEDMIFVKDINLVYLAASRSFAKLLGLQRKEDIVGKTDFDIFEHTLAVKYTKDDRYILKQGVAVENYIEPLPDQGGEKSYSSTSKYLIREHGEVVGIYGISRDVTTQVQLEAERENSKLSRAMFDNVLEVDLTNNRVLGVEGSGWIQELDQMEEHSFTDLVQEIADQYIHPDHLCEFLSNYDVPRMIQNFHLGTQEFSHISPVQTQEQRYSWIEFHARIYHSRISDTLRMTIFMKDKDLEVRHRQILQKKAITDALTGLANRDSILTEIQAVLEGADQGLENALLFIDLDRFKQVNDHWGHQFGDKVLQESALQLQQTFDKDELLGRIGGDEFVVFLKQVSNREYVREKSEQVVRCLSSYIQKDDVTIHVTASVGIVISKHQNACVDELYEQADRAMYRAKEAGGNRFWFYDEEC